MDLDVGTLEARSPRNIPSFVTSMGSTSIAPFDVRRSRSEHDKLEIRVYTSKPAFARFTLKLRLNSPQYLRPIIA